MEYQYYRTEVSKAEVALNNESYEKLMELYKLLPVEIDTKMKAIPGCAAVRSNGGFLTTIRGKKDLKQCTYVYEVDHDSRIVKVYNLKATLNAPLLDWIFKHNPTVHSILHTHTFNVDFCKNVHPYAPPGTAQDALRNIDRSFIIKDHGSFYLYDKKGVLIQ